ncbi:hypothetical protein AVEN_235014-1 [Araneus ventricosus]|uniref:Uncharacterized protein n=1 Tax=Araneus ventricosus TaxID=182803 RepID=A0A4Y2FMB1_ARAVE|nr:hypothetical protein AVEN_235014-1 [Araneus ventricosus]
MQDYRSQEKVSKCLIGHVERLMSLTYAERPRDIRDSLTPQYFIDAIRNEDTRHATRLMDAKDLKSTLAYSMKYEAAKTVSKTSRNVRSIEIENSTKKERDEKFDCLLKTLEKLSNNLAAGKKIYLDEIRTLPVGNAIKRGVFTENIK